MFFKRKNKPSSTIPAGRYRQPARSQPQRNAAVFSYHAQRTTRPTGTVRGEHPVVTAASKERRLWRIKWFKRSPLMVAFVVLLVFVGLNVPVSDSPKLLAVNDGNGGIFLRTSATYGEMTSKLLNASFWNSNKLTIDTHKLEAELEAQFPELADVRVSIPFIGTQPTVHLQPTSPSLILSTGATDVFVVDETGRALILASKVRGIAKLGLPVVQDGSGLPITLGEAVLPSSSVTYITEVAGQLKAKQVAIDSLLLPEGTSELHLKISGAGYIVKFNLMGDARAEVGTFLAVKQKLDGEHKTPREYIDVRVDERAYYR